MEHGNSPAYTYDELSQLKRTELNRIAKKLGINDLRGKNDMLIDKIIKVSETMQTEYDDEGQIVAVEKRTANERIHPVLGKYVKCMVTSRDPDIKAEYFSNNDYAARIMMNTEVMIPEGFINFIQKSCYSIEHYYDENRIDHATGKPGLHTSRQVPDFFCHRV